MLTTIAALIAVDFGLLLALKNPPLTFKFLPQVFLAISAAFFGISYFPKKLDIVMESPTNILEKYNAWRDHKIYWHKLAYSIFIIGLFAIALTYVIEIDLTPSSVKTSAPTGKGSITMLINATGSTIANVTSAQHSH
jgi:hypothetical protein